MGIEVLVLLASVIGQAAGYGQSDRLFRRLVSSSVTSEGTRLLQSVEECPGGAFLWKIVEDDTQEHVGFALGTIHLPYADVTTEATFASINAAAADSCDVYGELDLFSEEVLKTVMTCMLEMMGAGAPTPEALDLMRGPLHEFLKSTVDGHVLFEGRPGGGVEEAADQCELLSLAVDGQTTLFDAANDPAAQAEAEAMAELYKCGSIELLREALLASGPEGDAEEALEEALLDDRNVQIADEMDAVLSSTDEIVLFAFGLAHFIIGESSVENLLKDYGYSLVHVPHWSEERAADVTDAQCKVELNEETGLFEQMVVDDVETGPAQSPDEVVAEGNDVELPLAVVDAADSTDIVVNGTTDKGDVVDSADDGTTNIAGDSSDGSQLNSTTTAYQSDEEPVPEDLDNAVTADDTPSPEGNVTPPTELVCDNDPTWSYTNNDTGTTLMCKEVEKEPENRCSEVGADGRSAIEACAGTCDDACVTDEATDANADDIDGADSITPEDIAVGSNGAEGVFSGGIIALIAAVTSFTVL